MGSASEVVDRHTIEVEALRVENVVLRGSIADCMIQIEDLRMSLRLLAERQIGRAPLIDLTAEEEPVATGGEGTWKPVITFREHCEDRFTVLRLFLLRTI